MLTLGRNRMYRIGQYLNQMYQPFLTQRETNIEKFIQVKSSGSRRCLESVSALVAGLIGSIDGVPQLTIDIPVYKNLTNYWTPVPVRSVYPKGSDPMLDYYPLCPNVESEFRRVERWDLKLQKIFEENSLFIRQMSYYAGEKLSHMSQINELYQELYIERQHNYHWWKDPYRIWPESYDSFAIEKLRQLSSLYLTTQYDSL